jgi:hypothetical protein
MWAKIFKRIKIKLTKRRTIINVKVPVAFSGWLNILWNNLPKLAFTEQFPLRLTKLFIEALEATINVANFHCL